MDMSRFQQGATYEQIQDWVQNKYEGIIDSNPPFLYNRSHLIAYALTGQNANELNLITGTRYMNATTMLPWEEKVMRYLDHSDNHVLYRVTPYFKGKELVARGVEMEAYSVEDNGEGDGPDGDESEVFGGEVEQDVQGGGGFFFHGRYSL